MTSSGTTDITISIGGGGGGDAGEEVSIDPCNNQCGAEELCDEAHLGLDDNCNGVVDEGCACQAGQAHFCFKGNPAERGVEGCFDGTELCTEQGHFGPCIGGVHAWPPDNCSENDTTACHAIQAPPYTEVHLSSGIGHFGANAMAGSETYSVQCPPGVSQCPEVSPPDEYKPLQSGEYQVTYTKMVQGDPNPKSCTFSLFVGAPGLRVELSWDHSTADEGVDLDLHVHRPGDSQPWGISPGVPQDCTWSNCVVSDFVPSQSVTAPRWFADPPAAPPTPVNWFLDVTNSQNNTCYFDPRGVGAKWEAHGMGCHNPRLDVDNINCDYSITDPNNPSFCTPENINIDYPPPGEWIRIAVHYYNNHGMHYNVHPEVKVFCNGSLAADLGPAGYPDASPVTFLALDGQGIGGNLFWLVADVAFTTDSCDRTFCAVQPIYADETTKMPYFTVDDVAKVSFGPAYPPPP